MHKQHFQLVEENPNAVGDKRKNPGAGVGQPGEKADNPVDGGEPVGRIGGEFAEQRGGVAEAVEQHADEIDKQHKAGAQRGAYRLQPAFQRAVGQPLEEAFFQYPVCQHALGEFNQQQSGETQSGDPDRRLIRGAYLPFDVADFALQ